MIYESKFINSSNFYHLLTIITKGTRSMEKEYVAHKELESKFMSKMKLYKY